MLEEQKEDYEEYVEQTVNNIFYAKSYEQKINSHRLQGSQRDGCPVNLVSEEKFRSKGYSILKKKMNTTKDRQLVSRRYSLGDTLKTSWV